MELDETTTKFQDIFNPGFLDEVSRIVGENRRFVYYTSSETALKVINNKELWFRNATVMNDFSEISYGLNLCRTVFSGDEGTRFSEAVDDIFPDTFKRAEEFFADWERDWELETYIACVSLHNDNEDIRGRLSMW